MEASRWPKNEAQAPHAVGIDYVFSEIELDEILTFMQDNNSTPSVPPASLALQFLPSDGLGEPPYSEDLVLEGDAFQEPSHVQPFELGVPLDPELNPSSRQQSAEPRVKPEPLNGTDALRQRSAPEMPGLPSGSNAGALGMSDSGSLTLGAPGPGQAAHADAVPLSSAFAKLGAGGLSSPTPKPRQHSADLAPAAAPKRGGSVFLSKGMLLHTALGDIFTLNTKTASCI
jgi:hypothetical protein